MLSKVSADEVFMDYFQNMWLASGGFAPRKVHNPNGLRLWTQLVDSSLDPLIFPPLENILRAPVLTIRFI